MEVPPSPEQDADDSDENDSAQETDESDDDNNGGDNDDAGNDIVVMEQQAEQPHVIDEPIYEVVELVAEPIIHEVVLYVNPEMDMQVGNVKVMIEPVLRLEEKHEEPMVGSNGREKEIVDEDIFVDNVITQIIENIQMITPPVSPDPANDQNDISASGT